MTDPRTARHLEIAVIGGSSPSTPVLVQELAKSIARGDIGPVALRLYGRNRPRLNGIQAYAEAAMQRQQVIDPDDLPVSVRCSTDLGEALKGADIVIVQIRPGNMRFRGAAEAVCLRHGIPGDEGIGPGGLACFLRGRPSLDALATGIRDHAPRAKVVVLTSPLGLSVDRLESISGNSCIGVCELPVTTVRRTIQHVLDHAGLRITSTKVFGLNHQSWITEFQDEYGADRTEDVLNVAGLAETLGLEDENLEREAALPVHYLRLYYQSDSVVRQQLRSGKTRGHQLQDWSERLNRAYVRKSGVDVDEIDELLMERTVDWYEEGVVPVLAALAGDTPVKIPLNVRANGHFRDIHPRAVVEVSCRISCSQVTVDAQPALPRQAEDLLNSLIRYELDCQRIPQDYSAEDLVPVLVAHPLVKDREAARSLAKDITAEIERDVAAFGR